jgi:hypothetical protein
MNKEVFIKKYIHTYTNGTDISGLTNLYNVVKEDISKRKPPMRNPV